MANPTTSNRPHHHPVWAVLLFLLFLFHFFLDSQPLLTALCTERVVFRRLAPGQHLLVNPHLLIRRIEPLVITAQSDPRLDGIDTLSYRFLRSSATHMGGLLFWYGINADGNRTIQMHQSGGLLLDPGSTGSTPFQIDSTAASTHQGLVRGLC